MNPQKHVVLRCYYAGVHFGELDEGDGQRSVKLRNARRIWRWKGPVTLHELALRGCEAGSRISEPVSEIWVHDVVEQIAATKEAADAIAMAGWAP